MNFSAGFPPINYTGLLGYAQLRSVSDINIANEAHFNGHNMFVFLSHSMCNKLMQQDHNNPVKTPCYIPRNTLQDQ